MLIYRHQCSSIFKESDHFSLSESIDTLLDIANVAYSGLPWRIGSWNLPFQYTPLPPESGKKPPLERRVILCLVNDECPESPSDGPEKIVSPFQI